MEPMKVTLPYPPSVNHYVRFTTRGFAYQSKEAKAYKQGAKLRALTQGMRPILEGEVCLLVTVYRPAKRGDLDNHLKVLLDSLNGVAYADDKQVGELFVSRFEDAANPRVVVSVWPRDVKTATKPTKRVTLKKTASKVTKGENETKQNDNSGR